MTAHERPALWIAHNYSSDVGFAWTNISSLFASIAKEMRSRDVALLMSYASGAETAPRSIGDVPAAVEQFDFNRRGFRQALRAARIVRRHRVRYVYLTDQEPARWLYACLRLAGVRRIVVHNRISVANPFPATPDSLVKRSLKALWNRVPAVAIDRIYAVSDFVAQRLIVKARVPSRRVVRIYNGIDTSKFTPAERHNVKAGTIFAGCRADPHKGIDVLIDACAELARQGIRFEARYAGAGPALESFRSQVARLGLEDQFTFLGELRSVASEIRTAAVVAVPSNWGEALGSAVLEAMACAKPVVAARAGGIPEIIDDGVNGLLVPPGDSKALASALARVLQDPEYGARLGAAAVQHAVRTFDIKLYHRNVVDQLLQDFHLAAMTEKDTGPISESSSTT